MKLTRIDLNSWLLKAAGCTVLIDPWLVGSLTFYGQPWLFEATHAQPPAFTPETLPELDGILLSQGLDDHCHRPTLARLDRAVPVIGSKSAARVAQDLGFSRVEALEPWQETQIGALHIQAVPGAEVGQLENGYLITDRPTATVLYYEPHLSAPETLARLARTVRVDFLLIPVVGQAFPLLGEVLMGPERALSVVRALDPRGIVPTALGEIQIKGVLPGLIRSLGTLEEFAARLRAVSPRTTLYRPAPGQSVELAPSPSG